MTIFCYLHVSEENVIKGDGEWDVYFCEEIIFTSV